MHLNFEFKATVNELKKIEELLLPLQPAYKGEDHQTDTYFKVPSGRLKLREGNVENALIHYQRSNHATAKQSNVWLYQHQPKAGLKELLTAALGVLVVVEKTRRIYFVDNVKIHLDHVEELGSFVEVEAIDISGNLGLPALQRQCARFEQLFHIKPTQFVAASYSDLLLAKNSSINVE